MIMKGPCWIKLWISELAMINEQYRDDDGKIDFAALGREEYNFRVALITQKFEKSERAREVFELAKAAYETNVERGSKGGRPKKNKATENDECENQRTATAPKGKKTKKADSHSAKAAVRPLPPTVQEVYDFAEQQKIDKDDARDCFEMCESRQWADQYGELIGDWKGFIIGFCKSREEKRKSA